MSTSTLTFFYGVMGSAKTLRLLVDYHNFSRLPNKVVSLYKAELDTRSNLVKSRIPNLQATPTVSSLVEAYKLLPDLLFIDEAQFLTNEDLNQLQLFLENSHTQILAFGLKSDFQTNLFPASAWLLRHADQCIEVPTICTRCTNKAIYNMRLENKFRVLEGPVVLCGGDETYEGVCRPCYLNTPIKNNC